MTSFQQFVEGVTSQGEALLKASGNVVADEAECGDYELFVVYSKIMGFYQLAIQAKGKDFTDIGQQMEVDVSPVGTINRKLFKQIISKWLDDYGELTIASHNVKKTKVYTKLAELSGFKTEHDGFFTVISK